MSRRACPTGAVGDLDLLRYSPPGVRRFTMDPNAVSYFSIDAGATKLVNFNQNGADFANWGNGGTGTGDSSGNTPAQVQDAFGDPGVDVNIGTNELTALDVVGYDLVTAPEPTSFALLAIGSVGLLVRRRSAHR